MGIVRAVYVLVEGTPLGERLSQLWRGALPEDDPLNALVSPRDQIGEARNWGAVPHMTLVDVLPVSDSFAFDALVRERAAALGVCTLQPHYLGHFSRKNLVLEWDCPPLRALADALVRDTRHLLDRSPLSEEEWQRARWWISSIDHRRRANLQAFDRAHARYVAAGSPALPSSRYFRLGYLIRLSKEYDRSPGGGDEAQQHLDWFLRHGEPFWYVRSRVLHTTLASDLVYRQDPDETGLNRFLNRLRPALMEGAAPYTLRGLCVMGEDRENPVEVRSFDWLTETFVTELRPRLVPVERVPLGGAVEAPSARPAPGA